MNNQNCSTRVAVLALVRAYQVQGIPTTYFIDRNGVIQQVHIGEMTDELLRGYVAVIAEY